MRILANMFRSILYLGIGSLVGYYSFDAGGIISLLTNLFFFALGLLMVASWQSKPKKPLEQPLEEPSLDAQAIDANAVESPDTTVKTETKGQHWTDGSF